MSEEYFYELTGDFCDSFFDKDDVFLDFDHLLDDFSHFLIHSQIGSTYAADMNDKGKVAICFQLNHPDHLRDIYDEYLIKLSDIYKVSINRIFEED